MIRRTLTLACLLALPLALWATTIQVERPNQLPQATTIHDSDFMVLDQNLAGVRKIPLSFLRSIYSNPGAFSSNLTGTDAPAMPAPEGTIYLQVTGTNRQWWINAAGTNGSGWELWLSANTNSAPFIGAETDFTKSLKSQSDAAGWRGKLGLGPDFLVNLSWIAVGDGTNDDTAVIQSAFNSFQTNAVFDGSGKLYKITSPLVLPATAKYVTLRNARFKTGDHTGFTVATNTESPYVTRFVTFKDVNIDCSAHTTETTCIDFSRMSFSHFDHVWVSGVTGKTAAFRGWGNHANGEGPYYNDFDGCYCGGMLYGIAAGTMSSDVNEAANSSTVRNCRFQPATNCYGIYLDANSQNWTIVGNQFEHPQGGVGVYCDGIAHIFIGNRFEGLTAGLRVLSSLNQEVAHYNYGGLYDSCIGTVELFGKATTNTFSIGDVSDYNLYFHRPVTHLPGTVLIHSAQISQGPDTGALVVDGGVGIAERLSVGSLVHSGLGFQASGYQGGSNSWGYSTILGMVMQPAFGTNADFALASADGTRLVMSVLPKTNDVVFWSTTANNPGDTNSGAVTIRGGVGIAGSATLGGGLKFLGGGGAGPGSIGKDSVLGFSLQAATGSAYDFYLARPDGGGAIMYTPTGTQGINVGGPIIAGGLVYIPNNTWLYGGNSTLDGSIPVIGIDSADQINIAPGRQTTTIGGPITMGSTNVITRDVQVLVPGGGTNTLHFVNGSLFQVTNP